MSDQWHGETCKTSLLCHSVQHSTSPILYNTREHNSSHSIRISRATPLVRSGTHTYVGIPYFQDLPHNFITSNLLSRKVTYWNDIVLPTTWCMLLLFYVSWDESMSLIFARQSHAPCAHETDPNFHAPWCALPILYAPRSKPLSIMIRKSDPCAILFDSFDLSWPRSLGSLLEVLYHSRSWLSLWGCCSTG